MSATQKLLRFGVFELNLDTEELFKSGTLIKLAPQPFKLLALLASHAGQIVTRDEIQRRLWGQTPEVDVEHVVNKCIKQIRAALSDDADNPLYIETLPRQGYRFVAPVVSKVIPAPGPRVVESESGERAHPPVLIGGSGGTPVTVAGAVAPSYPVAMPDAEAAVGPAREVAELDESQSQPRLRRVGLVWIGAAVVLVGLIGGGLYYWRAHRAAPVLTEKDTMVIAEFNNTTGDDVFDGALKQGLTIQLEQSPFLKVLSDTKVGTTLKLMNRSGDERLTEELAREVCVRTNSKAIVAGSIANLGSQYVIGLKAVNCATGDVLAETQQRAANKEGVLKALDTAAARLRGELGESLASVQKYGTPLEEATTSSLEALQAESLGQITQSTKGPTAALPFYQRAVDLDPNFALAYVSMAVAYADLGEVGRAAENARKAYDLRDKVSDRERFSIEAFYYAFVTGELDKASQVYQLWQHIYPRDTTPYTDLGTIYASLGDWSRAVEEAQGAQRLEPSDESSYVNLGGDYAALNRLDEAEALYQQAEQHHIEGENLLLARYQLAFVRGDTATMSRVISAATGKPGIEESLLQAQADTAGWQGKLKLARDFTRRAMAAAELNDAKEMAASFQVAAGLREVESGNRDQALSDAYSAFSLAPNRDVKTVAALVLARAGATSTAEKMAEELDKTFPLDTMVQKYWLPAIRAAVALENKNPSRAVELLAVTSPIELSDEGLIPIYLRGDAYLQLHDGNSAAAEFQKFVDHRGEIGNFPWGALARLGLARAYAEQGDTAKAKAAYENFLTLWKNADPDIPIYKQAKAEYAQL